jgi:hypothetical protein
MNKSTLRAQKRRAKGICTQGCGRNAERSIDGKVYSLCVACKIKNKERMQALRVKRGYAETYQHLKSINMCVQCQKRPAFEDYVHCGHCRNLIVQRREKSKQ